MLPEVALHDVEVSGSLGRRYRVPSRGWSWQWGRSAGARGWGFVVGKTASCAAMALTFASYVVPGPWWAQRLVGVAGVCGLAALNYRGVSRTAVATRVLVVATLVALVVVVGGIAVASGDLV